MSIMLCIPFTFLPQNPARFSPPTNGEAQRVRPEFVDKGIIRETGPTATVVGPAFKWKWADCFISFLYATMFHIQASPLAPPLRRGTYLVSLSSQSCM